jgi:hypothetical protein
VGPTESFWILKVIFAFCDPALGLQCDNQSQWIEFRTVVGEWQAGFSAIAQRLLVYWHVRDLVAETSQQLSLEEGCRRLNQKNDKCRRTIAIPRLSAPA